MTPRRRILLIALSIAAPLPVLAFAQQGGSSHADVAPTRDVGAYGGVTPPGSGSPPRERVAKRVPTKRRGVQVVTWPGFQPTPNGGSRFFLQLTGNAETESRATAGRFELTIKNARTHVRNTRRPLETRFFNTPVTRAQLKSKGRRDLVMIFELRAPAAPTVRTQRGESGYQFLYVEFPPGDYLPEALRAPAASATLSPASARSSGTEGLSEEEMRQLERERPPAR